MNCPIGVLTSFVATAPLERDDLTDALASVLTLASRTKAAVAQWDELFSHDHAEPEWVAELRAAVAPFGGEL